MRIIHGQPDLSGFRERSRDLLPDYQRRHREMIDSLRSELSRIKIACSCGATCLDSKSGLCSMCKAKAERAKRRTCPSCGKTMSGRPHPLSALCAPCRPAREQCRVKDCGRIAKFGSTRCARCLAAKAVVG